MSDTIEEVIVAIWLVFMIPTALLSPVGKELCDQAIKMADQVILECLDEQ